MNPSRICRLSRDLVNKIAAGEVVERPASVVKELMENAIDAESSRIEVTLEEGGKKLIRVMDDGTGMSPQDLPLALEPHATSKLSDVEGLFTIDTLGFRGEALASIASVSRCRLVSRERGQNEGATLESEAGSVGEVRACGAPEGTIIEVRDLFLNTPARLKFLRTTHTELRHAIEVFNRLALPHPALDMTLIHNDRNVLRLPRCESARARIGALFSGNLSEGLLSVHSESSAMAVTGFVTPPGQGFSSSRQYVFLNGRYIRDRSIHRAIAEAYRSRMMRGKFPAAFLFMEMDPSRVDVNVHPTKVEVRFRDSGAVFAQVFSAIEKTLRSAGPAATQIPAPASRSRQKREGNIRQAITDFIERDARKPAPVSGRLPFAGKQAKPGTGGGLFEASASAPVPSSEPVETPAPLAPRIHERDISHSGPRIFCQMHDAYIVEQVADGFAVIDQHALHERILYEELRKRVSHGSVPRQKLLVPELVDLNRQDFIRVLDMREALRQMGLEVEAFGERTVAVHAVPHLGDNVNPRDLLLEILAEPEEKNSGQPTERQDQLMRVVACKAAVKAGQRLTHSQIEALLERRDAVGPEPTCPHGRPTTLVFDRSDIEKRFHRK